MHRAVETGVVVVGAGMAGLSAAHHLHYAGFRNITVLEAKGRYYIQQHVLNFTFLTGRLRFVKIIYVNLATSRNDVILRWLIK